VSGSEVPGVLTGKNALVTGGNSGIGMAIADALADAGANVVIWGRDAERSASAVSRLQRHGTTIGAVPCDVSDEASVQEAMDRTLELVGGLDTCVANAGVGISFVAFSDQTLELWRKTLATNLEGTFLTLRAAVRHMLDRGAGGSLVGVSSPAATMGMSKGQAYGASKAGITSMMHGLAVELGRHGIRANTLVPGFIETPMTPHFADTRFQEAVIPRIPMGTWGQPTDLGGIAVYLASDLSAYHTGDVLVLDGGFSRF
jgi:NAD(P)-dependent dehydrogenase (short-subunit alcohol dehydrogenase family)